MAGRAVVIAGKIIKELFILIHSDDRLICGADACIGTMIGYFTGNALLGMLVGGIVGVLNYKYIKRWLKLKLPAPANGV